MRKNLPYRETNSWRHLLHSVVFLLPQLLDVLVLSIDVSISVTASRSSGGGCAAIVAKGVSWRGKSRLALGGMEHGFEEESS